MQGFEELERALPGSLDFQHLASTPVFYMPTGEAARMGQPSATASAFTAHPAASHQHPCSWQLASPGASHLPTPLPMAPRDLQDLARQQPGPQDDGGKRRMRWSAALHTQFVEAVQQLGGAMQATPKRILALMSVPGLTLFHVKSHLQKYRNVLAEGGGAGEARRPAAARKRGAVALPGEGEEAAGEGRCGAGVGPEAGRGCKRAALGCQQQQQAAQQAAQAEAPPGGDPFASGPLLLPDWGSVDLYALDAELAATLAPAGGLEQERGGGTATAPAGAQQPQCQLSASTSSEPLAQCRSSSAGEGDGLSAAEAAADSGPPRRDDAAANLMLESALRVQLEMQRQLSSTIESQRKLQMQLEAHGKYIAELLRSDEAARKPPRVGSKATASTLAAPAPSHSLQQAGQRPAASACGASEQRDACLPAPMDRSCSASDVSLLRAASFGRGPQAAALPQPADGPYRGPSPGPLAAVASLPLPNLPHAASMPLQDCGAPSMLSAHSMPKAHSMPHSMPQPPQAQPSLQQQHHHHLHHHLQQHLQQRQLLQQQLHAHLQEQQRLRELLPPLVHQRQLLPPQPAAAAWPQQVQEARQQAAAALASEAEAQLLLANVLDGPFAQPSGPQSPGQLQARLGGTPWQAGSPPLHSNRSADSSVAAATAVQGAPQSLLPPGPEPSRGSCATSTCDVAPERGDSWGAAQGSAAAAAAAESLEQAAAQAAAPTYSVPGLEPLDDSLFNGDVWDSLLTDSGALNRLLCSHDLGDLLD